MYLVICVSLFCLVIQPVVLQFGDWSCTFLGSPWNRTRVLALREIFRSFTANPNIKQNLSFSVLWLKVPFHHAAHAWTYIICFSLQLHKLLHQLTLRFFLIFIVSYLSLWLSRSSRAVVSGCLRALLVPPLQSRAALCFLVSPDVSVLGKDVSSGIRFVVAVPLSGTTIS